jgi:hypothetical protein
MVLYEIMIKPIDKLKTHHYVADLSTDSPHQRLMPVPDFIIIEEH